MPKKFHFFLLYALYYIKRYFLVVILGIVFGSLTYLEQGPIRQFFRQIQFRTPAIGLEGLYTADNLPQIISRQLSYGLTTLTGNEKAIISPLVDDYQVDQNFLSHKFIFKPGLTWQNGKSFTPEDVVFELPGITTQYQDNSLTIKLEEPFAPLLSVLSQPIFLPKTMIGLGQNHVSSVSYKDGYIKKLTIRYPDHSIKTYNFYPSSEDIMTAFKLGEIDEANVSSLKEELKTWPKIKINQAITTDRYLAVFLNTEKYNKPSRQAIAYATPKTDDKNKRCLTPISPNSWAYNPQVKQYNFNPDRARELFEKDSFDRLNLIVTDRQLLDYAEKIKSEWEQIFKIKTTVTIANSQNDLSDFDAILAYNNVPYDPDQYTFWHSTQLETNNFTRLNNSRIDKLLEEGRQVQDQQERRQIYYDFQRYLLEESPVIFLEYPTIYTISRIK